MPISGYLFGFGAILLTGIALFFVVKKLGKQEEETSNLNDILKEVDRLKKQKDRYEKKVKSMSDAELARKLRERKAK